MSARCTGYPSRSQTWVGLTLFEKFHSSSLVALPIQPISHQPKQYRGDIGTAKIKVNQTKIRDLLRHTVDKIQNSALLVYLVIY